MILLIDNYDSFTYNLYQGIGKLYPDIYVCRNDEITLNEIAAKNPEAIIISPGPGYPSSAGISKQVIKEYSGIKPILGVCLGHQAIAEVFGGRIVHAKIPMHGKMSIVSIDTSCPLFAGLSPDISVARYHSLIVEKSALPDCLTILGSDDDGQIMALKHKEHHTYGVQFHPESILTECGMKILENFLTHIAGLNVTPLTAIGNALPAEKRNALKQYIFKAIEGENLSEEEAYSAMDCIMSGGATDSQIGAFLTALRMKGETIEEITGFAKGMRQKAALIRNHTYAVDIVGTGGDLANTFNISTTSAFVIAGAGQPVAKHGNRSVSSKSGSADVLEALGVKIGMTPAQAEECIDKIGLSFLFAQSFHGSMKFVATARREIGVRSVFNILGPLANPALTDYIILGVYDEDLMETMAKVLMKLGIKGAMIVHGNDGLDEITISDVTKICEVKGNKLIKYDLNPETFGIPIAHPNEVTGGTSLENAEISMSVLSGAEKGPKRNIVLLNAGCALYVAGKASTILDGIELAKESIDSGNALQKLQQLRSYTNNL